ncbi:MAG TPA: SpoVG family protein [Gemmataceae bacterium]|nr:SpoVG family protein [Gemmataceae bacterium]
MVITEVRIKLCEENNERLLAFCSVTFDNAFVVRDLKIIEGTKGVFVAMPSRKLTDRCGKCGCKNHLRARFCNSCGYRLDENRATRDMDGRAKLHADIAHPIHSGAREQIQASVIRAYQDEKEKAKMPGYVCTYDDYDGGDFDHEAPASYGSVVSEMGSKSGMRPHGPHAAPKGTHFGAADAPAARARAKDDDFGAGLV